MPTFATDLMRTSIFLPLPHNLRSSISGFIIDTQVRNVELDRSDLQERVKFAEPRQTAFLHVVNVFFTLFEVLARGVAEAGKFVRTVRNSQRIAINLEEKSRLTTPHYSEHSLKHVPAPENKALLEGDSPMEQLKQSPNPLEVNRSKDKLPMDCLVLSFAAAWH